MKIFAKQFHWISLSVIIAIILAFGSSSVAFAGGWNIICEEGLGGTWAGPDDFNGTCTFSPESATAIEACGTGGSTLVYFYGPEGVTGIECFLRTGAHQHQSTQGSDELETLCTIAGGFSRCAIFPPGTCEKNCSIDPHLPAAAGSALPTDAITTLYVRVVDESGEPGTGPYTVCFENPDEELLTIYRFLGGNWSGLSTGQSNPICAVISGDGAFYLGN